MRIAGLRPACSDAQACRKASFLLSPGLGSPLTAEAFYCAMCPHLIGSSSQACLQRVPLNRPIRHIMPHSMKVHEGGLDTKEEPQVPHQLVPPVKHRG